LHAVGISSYQVLPVNNKSGLQLKVEQSI